MQDLDAGQVVFARMGDRLRASLDRTRRSATGRAFEALQRKLGVEEPSPEITCTLPAATVLDILQYHVTDGRRFSNSVFNKRSSKMIGRLNGQYIVTNPNLTINDNAGKTITPVKGLIDINASNGVIHVIDAVLEP